MIPLEDDKKIILVIEKMDSKKTVKMNIEMKHLVHLNSGVENRTAV